MSLHFRITATLLAVACLCVPVVGQERGLRFT
jgi:hypothetical protein